MEKGTEHTKQRILPGEKVRRQPGQHTLLTSDSLHIWEATKKDNSDHEKGEPKV